MKKRFLAVPLAVGVAGASWAGGTLYGGAEARAAYDRLLADVGDASGLTLVPQSYEAGFLHSEAVTELRAGAGDDAPTLVRFRHVIDHSPVGNAGLRAARIVTTADTSTLDPEMAAALTAFFDGAPPLVVESVLGLGGDAEHAITLAPWSHEDERMRVAGGAAQWTVRQSGDGTVSGTGAWPGMTLASLGPDGSEITMGASHDRFEYREASDGLYVGEYAAELGDLRGDVAAAGMTGALSGMRLSSTSEIAGDEYRGEAAFEIGSMELPVALDSLRLHVGFDGFPVAATSEATRAATAFDVAMLSADESVMEEALASYLSAVGGMLRPGLSIDYGLELANAGGRATADYAMSWAGPEGRTGLDGLETVGDLARAVKVSATIDVDDGALALTPAAMFVDADALAPWVVRDADGYRADLSIDNLVMDLNGQPMPLEMMAGEALDMSLEGLLEGAI